MRVYDHENVSQRALIFADRQQSKLIRKILLDVYFIDLLFLEEVSCLSINYPNIPEIKSDSVIENYRNKLSPLIAKLDNIYKPEMTCL